MTFTAGVCAILLSFDGLIYAWLVGRWAGAIWFLAALLVAIRGYFEAEVMRTR